MKFTLLVRKRLVAHGISCLLVSLKGAALFIDEAYNLGQGHFGKEACDALVAGMTSEDYRDVLVIIALFLGL